MMEEAGGERTRRRDGRRRLEEQEGRRRNEEQEHDKGARRWEG